MPRTLWTNTFTENAGTTTVNILAKYESLHDLEKIIGMGFKDGFTMALENLDQYIEAQFKLRKQNKTNNKARVTTYLNFRQHRRSIFVLQSVFKTEFAGKGIQRFGDIPAEAGHPPIADEVKKMILHVELPITEITILMANRLRQKEWALRLRRETICTFASSPKQEKKPNEFLMNFQMAETLPCLCRICFLAPTSANFPTSLELTG